MQKAASDLHALQSAFARHLLQGDAAFACEVRAGKGLGAGPRLNIYHHAYRARLVDALRDSFGHAATYLGDSAFDAAALAFIECHPSRQASLNDYGAEFAAWLGRQQATRPEAAELAQLDWALRRAFDGPDARPLDLAALAAVDPAAWSHVCLTLVPTATRLSLSCHALALWQVIDLDAPLPLPECEAPPDRAELLVWRRGDAPHFRSLDEGERLLIDALRQGCSFASACDALARQSAGVDVAPQAGKWLRRWVDEGLLAAVVVA